MTDYILGTNKEYYDHQVVKMIIFICFKTHPATGMAIGSDHVECRL